MVCEPATSQDPHLGSQVGPAGGVGIVQSEAAHAHQDQVFGHLSSQALKARQEDLTLPKPLHGRQAQHIPVDGSKRAGELELRGQKTTPRPSPPRASQLPRVQLLIQQLGGARGVHPEAWGWATGSSAGRAGPSLPTAARRGQRPAVATAGRRWAKGVNDTAADSFPLGSSLTPGKAKMKVKLDSDLVPRHCSSCCWTAQPGKDQPGSPRVQARWD